MTILPSLVPGVRIDSAGWQTYAATVDAGARETLIYAVRVRAEHDLPLQEVAVLYRPAGRPVVVDATLKNLHGLHIAPGTVNELFVRDSANPSVYELKRGAWERFNSPLLSGGGARTFTRGVGVQAGFKVGERSGLTYCPTGTVQLVPRSDVALYLGARSPPSMPPAAAVGAPPLRIDFDTLIAVGEYSSMLVGLVRNMTDTTLRDMVAGIVVHQALSNLAAKRITPRQAAIRDTIEHRFDSIPPRAVVPFAGGDIAWTERVVERVAYPASIVRGRPIAGAAEGFRSNHDLPRWALPLPRGSADPIYGCWTLAQLRVTKRVGGSRFEDSLPLPVRFRVLTKAEAGGQAENVREIGAPDLALRRKGSSIRFGEDSVAIGWSARNGYVRVGVAVEGDTLVGAADWYPNGSATRSMVTALVRAPRATCPDSVTR
jgi:hypothetical protein